MPNNTRIIIAASKSGSVRPIRCCDPFPVSLGADPPQPTPTACKLSTTITFRRLVRF